MWVNQFPGGGRRLVVDVEFKVSRDELCQAWGHSVLHQREWPDATIRACLTVGEDAQRKRILRAFQVPPADESATLSG